MTMATKKRQEYCDILGVDEDASKEEIRKAYKMLAIQCHPDKNQLNPEATKEFQRISEAYTGLCQGDDYCEDEDDFDNGGFSVIELLQMFFMRSKLFMRPAWFGHDQSLNSGNPCNSDRRNIWNYSNQPTWNEDWQMPGTTRFTSSLAGRGNSGRTKGKQNNNQKNASSQKSSPKASQPRNSGSSTLNVRNNIDACSGEGISVATKSSSDGLTPEPAAGIQSADEKVLSDEGRGNTGPTSDFSVHGVRTTDEIKNGDVCTDRRGSNASVNGSAQNADRKPSKKKLQAEQRKRDRECAEIHKEVLEKNQKEEEKRKRKEEKEKEKAKIAEQSMAYQHPLIANETEKTNSQLFAPGVEESCNDHQRSTDVEASVRSAQETQFPDPQSPDSPDRIADDSECIQESLEILSNKGINDEGIDSSELSKDAGSEKKQNDSEDPGKSVHLERRTFSRTFYSNSGNHFAKRSAGKSSDSFKDAAEKFKAEGDQCSNSSLQDRNESGNFTENNYSRPGDQYNSRCFTEDNVFGNRGRHSSSRSGRRGQMHQSRASNAQLEGDVESEREISASKRSTFIAGKTQMQNFQHEQRPYSFEGQHYYRGSRGGKRRGFGQGYNRNYGQSGNENDSSGFDGHRQVHLPFQAACYEERLKYTEDDGIASRNLAKNQRYPRAAEKSCLLQNRPDPYGQCRNDVSHRGWNRGLGRGKFRANAVCAKNAGWKQEPDRKYYGANDKTSSGFHGVGRDAFSGRTLEFFRSKPTSEGRNDGGHGQFDTSLLQNQLASNKSLTESSVQKPVLSSFTAPPEAPAKNVWKDRQEFYAGALPKSKEEEDKMLEAALKLSQLDVEREPKASFVENDREGCSSSSQINRDADETVGSSSFLAAVSRSWADEMEEIVEHSPSDSRATSFPSSHTTSGIHSSQSVSDGGAECVKDRDRFTGALPRRSSDEGRIICSELEHKRSFPNDVVSSVTMNPTHGTVDLSNAAGCVQLSSLKHVSLDSELPDEIGGSHISETFQTREASKDTLKVNGDTLNVLSVQTEDCVQIIQHSVLDGVDDYRTDVILGQPLSEFDNDDESENVGLDIDGNSSLENGECIFDLLGNKGIGDGNDLTGDNCAGYAVCTGHFPQMLPNCYPAHPGSMPWHPYPFFLPYMVSGAPMMPTASQLPSCLMHTQGAEHCSSEAQLIPGLPEHDDFTRPPLIAPMFTAFPNGFNLSGLHMTPYGYQVSPYFAMHVPPFQQFHPAHGEIDNSALETGHAKPATEEI